MPIRIRTLSASAAAAEVPHRALRTPCPPVTVAGRPHRQAAEKPTSGAEYRAAASIRPPVCPWYHDWVLETHAIARRLTGTGLSAEQADARTLSVKSPSTAVT